MLSSLKIMTCGSVDDGKSTLIGHLIYHSKTLFVDTIQALELDSKVKNSDSKMDYSLLLDGLTEEREQGITIDVAYRYFTTNVRRFVIADAPGHEQYTRNMAVAASSSNLAIVLIDARKGILKQTKRHLKIAQIMGIKHFIFAINKMDLIEYDEQSFNEIANQLKSLIRSIDHHFIVPVSATTGEGLVSPFSNMSWFKSKTIFEILQEIDVEHDHTQNLFAFSVQRVSRPNQDFRGYQGEIFSGQLKVGDLVVSYPSMQHATIKSLYKDFQKITNAHTHDAITIELDQEIDCSRGDVLINHSNYQTTDLFQAEIIWMEDHPLELNQVYLIKIGTQILNGQIEHITHFVDFEETQIKKDNVVKNDVATVLIRLSKKILLFRFEDLPRLGSFIIINKQSNMTSSFGMIQDTKLYNREVFMYKTSITPKDRSDLMQQQPFALWFTGLSGSGKSTLANEIEKLLNLKGYHTMLLDGDNMRHGLNSDLGFNDQDRHENIRRVSEVTKILNEAGLIVITSFISPFKKDRELARSIIGSNMHLIHLSTPLEVCESRDVKGIYAKARKGDIQNFTGISSTYEIPLDADLTIDTSQFDLISCVEMIMRHMKAHFEIE
jgi:bifunctional enzyme CysN/CysC